MSTPDENTRINVNDDTVIGVDVDDDTIIRVPIEETVVGSVDIIEQTVIDTAIPDDNTVIGVSVLGDATVITIDDTVTTESTTDEYNTLLRSMVDTSEGLRALIEEIDEEAAAEAALAENPEIGNTAPQAELASRFSLRHISGARHQLTKPLIMGRMPAAPLRGERGVSLLVLASPGKLVSSTHARVEVVGDVVVVTDLRSTNGTRILIPGQPAVLLAPGGSMALDVGAIIDLGDGNRLEVLG